MKLDAALSRLARGGPAEPVFFQPLCRDPEARAVEIGELDAVAELVGEDEEDISGGCGLELVGGERDGGITLK